MSKINSASFLHLFECVAVGAVFASIQSYVHRRIDSEQWSKSKRLCSACWLVALLLHSNILWSAAIFLQAKHRKHSFSTVTHALSVHHSNSHRSVTSFFPSRWCSNVHMSVTSFLHWHETTHMLSCFVRSYCSRPCHGESRCSLWKIHFCVTSLKNIFAHFCNNIIEEMLQFTGKRLEGIVVGEA